MHVMRSMSAQDIRKLQQQIPGGQFIEGSNAGNAASDAADRADSPAVESPLKRAESAMVDAVCRYISKNWPCCCLTTSC